MAQAVRTYRTSATGARHFTRSVVDAPTAIRLGTPLHDSGCTVRVGQKSHRSRFGKACKCAGAGVWSYVSTKGRCGHSGSGWVCFTTSLREGYLKLGVSGPSREGWERCGLGVTHTGTTGRARRCYTLSPRRFETDHSPTVSLFHCPPFVPTVTYHGSSSSSMQSVSLVTRVCEVWKTLSRAANYHAEGGWQ